MDKRASELRKEILTRKAEMDNEFSTWWPHAQEITDYIQPRRGRYFVSDRNKGQKRRTLVNNNEAGRALRTMVGGLTSGLVSASLPWCRIATVDPGLMEFGPAKEWLHYVTNWFLQSCGRSNFYNVMPTQFEELGLFGTHAMCLYADDQDTLRFYPYTYGEYRLALGPRLEVDTMFRSFSMTVRQAVQTYGKDKVSPSVKQSFDKGNYNEWVEILHVIEPNVGRDIDKIDGKNKPIRSIHLEVGRKAEDDRLGFLRMSGFDSSPLVAPRWHVTPPDVYGTSPAMEALGNVKELRDLRIREGQVRQKISSPVMNAPASMRNEPISLLPAGLNFHDQMTQGSGTLTPAFQIPPVALTGLQAAVQEIKQEIRADFYADLFLLIASGEGDPKTAYQVAREQEEKLAQLYPVTQNLHSESLSKIIDRAFYLGMEAGEFPPPPEELQGTPLKVEYLSILAQAQKMIGLSAIDRLLTTTVGLAEAAPQVMDKIDWDQAIDELGDRLGVPPAIVLSDDKVEALRKARAQQQAITQQTEQAGNVKALAEAARAASQADTGTKNLLTDMMGG